MEAPLLEPVPDVEQILGDLSQRGADQARHFVADALWLANPVVLGPAADQVDAPLVGCDVGQPFAGTPRLADPRNFHRDK